MAFTITNATDVAIVKTDRLLVDAVEEVQYAGIIGTISEVKGSMTTPDLLTTGTEFKDGDFTGVTAGGVEIKDVTVTNALFTSEEQYQTTGKLAKTVYKMAMKAGINPEDFPIQDAVLAIKKNDIVDQIDTAIFLGDTTGTGAVIQDKVDGLVKKIKASALTNIDNEVEGQVYNSGIAAAAFAASTCVAKVVAFCNTFETKFPKLKKQQINVYISPENFRVWFQATFGTAGVINANTLNNGVMPSEMMHPAFNHFNIVAVDGMIGSNEMFAGQPENFNAVIDGDPESDFMTMHFSKDKEAFLLHTAMRMGTAIVHLYEVLLQAVIPTA